MKTNINTLIDQLKTCDKEKEISLCQNILDYYNKLPDNKKKLIRDLVVYNLNLFDNCYSKNKHITFLTFDGIIIDENYNTNDKTTELVIILAKELAKEGYRVTIFANPGENNILRSKFCNPRILNSSDYYIYNDSNIDACVLFCSGSSALARERTSNLSCILANGCSQSILDLPEVCKKIISINDLKIKYFTVTSNTIYYNIKDPMIKQYIEEEISKDFPIKSFESMNEITDYVPLVIYEDDSLANSKFKSVWTIDFNDINSQGIIPLYNKYKTLIQHQTFDYSDINKDFIDVMGI